MKWILFILNFWIFSISVYTQNIIVNDFETKQSIPNAHIKIHSLNSKNFHFFQLTNSNGRISLEDVQPEKFPVIIEISFFGYEKIQDTLKEKVEKTYFLIPEQTTLNEVVVTGQYAPNSPEKAVHTIKIIDSKKIEAMGAVNLRDVLTNELNIRISQDNVLGSGMSLQGISGQNVKILIDGVPVTGRLNGNIDISQINMNNVERIEIIEGPLSVSYGTDALAGTINIITKKSQKEVFTISSHNYYESNGQYNFTGKVGVQKNKHFIGLTGGRNYFDGWKNNDSPFYYESNPIADSSRFKNWKPKEQYFGTFNYSVFIKNIKIGYTSDYFYEEVMNRGYPRQPYQTSAFDDYYLTNRITNSINISGKLSKNYRINLIFSNNHFKRTKNTFFKDLTTLEEILTPNPSDQDTSTFVNYLARGTFSFIKDSSKINFEMGYDLNHETGYGIRIKNSRQDIGDYAIFSSAEYKPISNLIIRPGLRIAYNTAYQAPIIPSFNMKYSLFNKNKSNDLSFRFSYARGFRSPSLKELYFYFVDINHNISGNENLKAEYSNNFSLSTSYFKRKNNNAFKSQMSFFYNQIDNMISLAQSDETSYSYFNIEYFITKGAQLNNEFSFKHLKFLVGGSYIGRYNQLSDLTSTKKFIYSPEARFNVFYEWHKQKLNIGLFYKYTGKMPGFFLDSDGNVYNTRIDDFHTLDASISKLFWKNKIQLVVGAKNIFNVTNINGFSSGGAAHSSGSNSVVIGMGRTYFFKADIFLNANKK